MAGDLDVKIRLSAEIKELKKALGQVKTDLAQLSSAGSNAGAGAAQGLTQLEDGLTDAARAAGLYRDEAGKIREANGRFASSSRQVELGLRRVEDAADDAGKKTGELGDILKGMRNQVVGLVTAWASWQGVMSFVEITDEAKNLESRLRLVQKAGEDLATTQERLRDVSRETRTSFAETVGLYSRLAQASSELEGANQATLLRLTDITNKLVQISGADGPAAEAALMQFGQALASGQLRGDELNSILEQTPEIAYAIADGMGVARGQIRSLAEDGKLTAETVVNALIKMGDTTDKRFGQMAPTIGQQLTLLRDEWRKFVNELDQDAGISQALIASLVWVREHLDEIVLVVKLLAVAMLAAFGPRVLVQIAAATRQMIAFAAAANSGAAAMTRLQKASALLFALFAGWEIGTYLREQFVEVERAGIALMAGLHRTYAETEGLVRQAGATFEAAFDDPLGVIGDGLRGLIRLVADFVRKIPGVGDALADSMLRVADRINPGGDAGAKLLASLDRIKAETAAKVAEIDEGYADLFANAGKAADALDKQTKQGGVVGTVKAKKAKGAGGTVDALALQRADTEEQQRLNEQAFADGEIRLAAYYERRRELARQMAAIDQAELDRKLKAADTADAKSAALTEKELARRRAAVDQDEINRAERDALEQRANDAERLQIQLTRIEGDAVAARKAELLAQYRDTLEQMKTEGDAAGIDLVHKLINAEVAGEQLEQLKQKIANTLQQQTQREEDIGRQVELGAMGDFQGTEEINASREVAIEQLQRMRAELELLAQEGAPGAKQAVAELDARVAQLAATSPTMFKQIGGALVSGLGSALDSIVDGTKSAGEAMRDMARQFLISIAQIIVKAIALQAMLLALNAIPGGAAVASALGMTANVKHTGGVVGSGGTVRSVDPSLFAMAPRYHSGGVAGLKPGEVPAILQAGEEVLTRDNPRHVANQGQAGGSGVRILNVVDPNLVGDYMNSSGGEETIVNTIQRNAGAIKQLLG